MKNAYKDFENLSLQEKKSLLIEELKSRNLKYRDSGSGTKTGFRFPEAYLQLKERFDAFGEMGYDNIYFQVSEGINGDTTVIKGRKLINYSSYNYLGLSGDPRITRFASEAMEKYGTSVSASRIASGERPLHRELEQAIAELLHTDDSIVFVGGYGTNETVIGHLMGDGDLILFDSLIHASIQQGCRQSGATLRPFPHNNWKALDRILENERGRFNQVLIVTEGVYSMDGDIPDLPRFIAVKKKHDALLMVDEAHSIGVLGDTGRGIREYYDVPSADVDLWMGTLSKSFASCGGYIAGDAALIEYLRYTVPGFVYSVGISPANTAAALAAIRILTEEPERARKIRERASFFLELAREKGFNTGESRDSGVVPVILGDSLKSLQLYQYLFDNGILALPVMYPTVPENAARLRFFICTSHTEGQIRKTVDCISDFLKEKK